MKHVWVKAATCSCTAATTRGAALPTLTTAIPAPRSMRELPSTSTTTPPPARSTKTGRVVPTPADTVAARRASSSRDRGPGISVTRRRSCGTGRGGVSSSVTGTPWGSGAPRSLRRGTATRVRVWACGVRGDSVRSGARSPAACPIRRCRAECRPPISRPGGAVPVTVAGLVASPALELRLHTTAAPVDRPISWVHVSELGDPAPFLGGGELLRTTGLALRDGAVAGKYVARLVDAGAVGLGFGTGLGRDEVPPELVAAAEARGLALLEVPRRIPFIALSRTVSAALAADEYAAVAR